MHDRRERHIIKSSQADIIGHRKLCAGKLASDAACQDVEGRQYSRCPRPDRGDRLVNTDVAPINTDQHVAAKHISHALDATTLNFGHFVAAQNDNRSVPDLENMLSGKCPAAKVICGNRVLWIGGGIYYYRRDGHRVGCFAFLRHHNKPVNTAVGRTAQGFALLVRASTRVRN